MKEPRANVHTFHLLLPSGPESLRSLPTLLLEMLLLVSGEVHQVPQQERLHHGESSSFGHLVNPEALPPVGTLTSHTSACLSDRHLWEKLLRFCQKCFSASDEKHHQVSQQLLQLTQNQD